MFFYFLLRRSIYFFLLLFPLISWSDLATDTIYLTWQQSPETTMTIQWISKSDQQSTSIDYQEIKDSEWQNQIGRHFIFPHTIQYLIHRVELTSLKPHTLYRFRIANTEQVYLFQTMPAYLDQNDAIQFVVGGDMYHDGIDIMKETSRQAALSDPAFALIGGDIAYAVGGGFNSFQNIQRWIEWIKAWHECMVTKEGRLIPVIAAIGNHDLIGQFSQTPSQAKVFSSLFPMPGEKIYNVLDFGSYLSLLLLDSGHAHPINGNQTNWLKHTLQERQDVIHRFAIYHVPAYSSIRAFNNRYSRLIRHYWVPLFEKEQLHIAFENHDHAYKRTYPLIRNKVDPAGVVYIGDGAWGIEQPRKLPIKKRFYMAKTASARHFLLVTLRLDQRQVTSIDYKGHILDDYNQRTTILLQKP